jgi:hypothetical protein
VNSFVQIGTWYAVATILFWPTSEAWKLTLIFLFFAFPGWVVVSVRHSRAIGVQQSAGPASGHLPSG